MINKIKQLEEEEAELKKELARQKIIKEELKDSEERFKIMFEYAPDSYFLSDLKGVFIDGNKAAERLIGYKREELINKSMLKLNLLSLNQIPKAAKRLAEHALGRATTPGEFILTKKDGTKIIAEISGALVKIKGKKLVLGIVRDITERKKTEEELKKQNEKLEGFNKLAIGRELKMVELKNKIKELEEKIKELEKNK